MLALFHRYTDWLHTQWPAGLVEKMPQLQPDGRTDLPGVRIVGDLTGVPLLKFSADTGARAVSALLAEKDFRPGALADGYDLVIIGAGVAGVSAAIEAGKAGLQYVVYEAQEAFSTIKNFPRRKPIYAYPSDLTPAGEMRFQAEVKEALVDELEAQRRKYGIQPEAAEVESIEKVGSHWQVRFKKEARPAVKAQRVIVAIGRTGNFRKLNVPGENLGKVSNRLIDAGEYSGQKVLVVGGGDSALEAAIALARAGAQTTLSYRKKEFQRPKPDNIAALQQLAQDGRLQLLLGSQVQEIGEKTVTVDTGAGETELPNDQVFILIGREPPLEFFRKSRLPVINDRTPQFWWSFAAFFLFTIVFYHWQKGLDMGIGLQQLSPAWMAWVVSSLGGLLQAQVDDPHHLLHHLRGAMNQPGFYYSAMYSVLVCVFGWRRIRRRKTPYVTLQTVSLALFQVIPLFLLPWIVLPWLGANGWFEAGPGKWIGDQLWPNGEYWRAFGLILAWPLFVYNWFTAEPLWGWLILGSIQTFVIIPYIVWRWGKGAYCGWVCSCGALAETLGDAHRHKMPHGPFWNRLNMVGQVILWAALLLMLFRILGWVFPGSVFGALFASLFANPWHLDYKNLVDFWLAGVIGIGLYFHFSGRTWCRFACPLAALMHIYARFSRFRIFADKKKCISCNACTTVCHQGIDIMNFANKGRAMEDPECVRCSACVQVCPTGTLNFGYYDQHGRPTFERLWASPVQQNEAALAKTPIDVFMEVAARRAK